MIPCAIPPVLLPGMAPKAPKRNLLVAIVYLFALALVLSLLL